MTRASPKFSADVFLQSLLSFVATGQASLNQIAGNLKVATSCSKISDDARNLVFFYQDPQTTHIRLHTIKDYIP